MCSSDLSPHQTDEGHTHRAVPQETSVSEARRNDFNKLDCALEAFDHKGRHRAGKVRSVLGVLYRERQTEDAVVIGGEICVGELGTRDPAMRSRCTCPGDAVVNQSNMWAGLEELQRRIVPVVHLGEKYTQNRHTGLKFVTLDSTSLRKGRLDSLINGVACTAERVSVRVESFDRLSLRARLSQIGEAPQNNAYYDGM